MKRWISLALIIGFVVMSAVLSGCQGTNGVEAGRYSLDVEVRPSDDDPEGVVCNVTLEDATSGEVVLRPVLLTSWGEAATITQGNEAESFVFTVMADNETQRIEYSAQYLQYGVVVFQSRAQVSLVARVDA